MTEPQGKKPGSQGEVFPGEEKAMHVLGYTERAGCPPHPVHLLRGQGSGNLHGEVYVEAIGAVVKKYRL